MNHSKVIHTDYYVISDDFRLLEFNQNVKDRYKGIQCGDLCYQATMKRDTPCHPCPIAGNSRNDCPLYYVNERMIEMLGYDSREDFEEGIDRKVVNTIHPDDLLRVTADLGNRYYVGKKYETTYRMV